MKRAIPSLMVARWATTQYLLDTYTGALGAYSLRQLRTGQTNCIRVYRASDSAEQDFGFVNGVLDIASLSTFTAGTFGDIVTWYDQSGNGNDGSALNPSLRPNIADLSGLITTNGKTSVDFRPSADPRYIAFPTGFLNGATNLSYFQVAKITEPGSSLGGVFGPLLSSFAGLEILQLNVISRPTYFRFNGGSGRNDNSGAAYQLWNDATQSLTTILGNPTSTAAYKNSAAVTLTDSSAMPALNFNGVYNFGIYNNGPDMDGYMQELIIYDSDKTSNRAAIEANINAYYTIF